MAEAALPLHSAKTPYYSFGVLIDKNNAYVKVYAKAGLVLMWNLEDALMLELSAKFNNRTCGLCGDYNGVPVYNEFINKDMYYGSITFGNLQKVNKPNDDCVDPDETQSIPVCSQHRSECEKLLTMSAFDDCKTQLNLEPYIQACMQDMCSCPKTQDSFCLCSTISEYSRQCSHAGGQPQNWRTENFCSKQCPTNMVYLESGSPCMNTCSHLDIRRLCEEHRMDGCFCPEGTVVDDLTGAGCVPVSKCHCKLHGSLYSPGQRLSTECEDCVCNSGKWVCKDLPCPGTCSVEGGAHFTSFDGKKYTLHGDCYYVFSKGLANDSHVVLGELTPCGTTERETCLKTVILLTDNRSNVVTFKEDGSVLLNELEVNLPYVTASFSILQPSSFHIIVQTSFDLQMQIQLAPIMQLYLTMERSARNTLQGLCGNFNAKEGDDFQSAGGLVEAMAAAFANTWKAQASCHDKTDLLADPCSLSIESETYAEHWCSWLKKPETPFAKCQSTIDPSEYYKRCKYDTCSCRNSEDCMCAALSSYARACAAKGILLWNWRKDVCNKGLNSCPASQIFLYNITACQPTCRSLSDTDKACSAKFIPVDGCGCPEGTYINEKNKCVPESDCSCYFKSSYLNPGDVVYKQDERCTCRNGKLHCVSVHLNDTCSSDKIYLDCNIVLPGSSEFPVQRSCQAHNIEYFRTECVSGCVCPEGLMDDGKGVCVEEDDCPCVHNERFYSHGAYIKVDCNTCTCRRGKWSCTNVMCYGTCTIYGSGHYITFDGKSYDFDGHCEYVASQDYCGGQRGNGTFSIITENVPCGTTGVTCSKAIKVFLGNIELKLEDKQLVEIQTDTGKHVSYLTHEVGIYLVIQASNGVMLIWDKKTTIFINLSPAYKGKVCGLCGNFDGISNNDFTSRHQLLVTKPLEFGNSWKATATCPDVDHEILPCELKPHRKAWAEKQCSLIKSEVFKICHSKVDPNPFYEACVHDACSCDSGGDCECFCTAVAAYAQECTKAEACVYWRTPDICPIFCDYYNPPHECEWHYEPCGNHSVLTCRSINNIYSNVTVTHLEGCYPRCPLDRPIFDEDNKKCVTEEQCGCYVSGVHYPENEPVPTEENCTSCICTSTGSVNCSYNESACYCVYNGTRYEVGEIIFREENAGFCSEMRCEASGIQYNVTACSTTAPPSTLSTTAVTTTTSTTPTTVSTTVLSSTTCVYENVCQWSQWFDVSKPTGELDSGDFETYEEIRKHGYEICRLPEDIQCRAASQPDLTLEQLGQKVQCNVSNGLICRNEEQDVIWNMCYNYEIRVNCCSYECLTSSPTTTTPATTTPIISTPTSTTTASPTTTTPITKTSTITTPTTISTTVSTTTVCSDGVYCNWTGWIDVSYPSYLPDGGGGDFETYDEIRKHGYEICKAPSNISCRAEKFPDTPIEDLDQEVECDVSTGLVCENKDQNPFPVCLNYEVNIYCCWICQPHSSTPTPTTTPSITTSTTIISTTATTTISSPTRTTTLTITSSSTSTPITTTTTHSTTTPTPSTTTPTITSSSTPTPTTTTTTHSTTTPTPSTTTPTITSSSTPTPTTTTTTHSTTTPTPSTTTPTITSSSTPTQTTTTTHSTTPIPSTTTPTITSSSTPTQTATTTTTTHSTTTSTPSTTTPTITSSSTPTPTTTTTTHSTTTSTPSTTTPTITSSFTPTQTTTTTTTSSTTTPTPSITTPTITSSTPTQTATTTTHSTTPTPSTITPTITSSTPTPTTTTTQSTTTPTPSTTTPTITSSSTPIQTTITTTHSTTTPTPSTTTPTIISSSTPTPTTTTTHSTTTPTPSTTTPTITSSSTHTLMTITTTYSTTTPTITSSSTLTPTTTTTTHSTTTPTPSTTTSTIINSSTPKQTTTTTTHSTTPTPSTTTPTITSSSTPTQTATTTTHSTTPTPSTTTPTITSSSTPTQTTTATTIHSTTTPTPSTTTPTITSSSTPTQTTTTTTHSTTTPTPSTTPTITSSSTPTPMITTTTHSTTTPIPSTTTPTITSSSTPTQTATTTTTTHSTTPTPSTTTPTITSSSTPTQTITTTTHSTTTPTPSTTTPTITSSSTPTQTITTTTHSTTTPTPSTTPTITSSSTPTPTTTTTTHSTTTPKPSTTPTITSSSTPTPTTTTITHSTTTPTPSTTTPTITSSSTPTQTTTTTTQSTTIPTPSTTTPTITSSTPTQTATTTTTPHSTTPTPSTTTPTITSSSTPTPTTTTTTHSTTTPTPSTTTPTITSSSTPKPTTTTTTSHSTTTPTPSTTTPTITSSSTPTPTTTITHSTTTPTPSTTTPTITSSSTPTLTTTTTTTSHSTTTPTPSTTTPTITSSSTPTPTTTTTYSTTTPTPSTTPTITSSSTPTQTTTTTPSTTTPTPSTTTPTITSSSTPTLTPTTTTHSTTTSTPSTTPTITSSSTPTPTTTTTYSTTTPTPSTTPTITSSSTPTQTTTTTPSTTTPTPSTTTPTITSSSTLTQTTTTTHSTTTPTPSTTTPTITSSSTSTLTPSTTTHSTTTHTPRTSTPSTTSSSTTPTSYSTTATTTSVTTTPSETLPSTTLCTTEEPEPTSFSIPASTTASSPTSTETHTTSTTTNLTTPTPTPIHPTTALTSTTSTTTSTSSLPTTSPTPVSTSTTTTLTTLSSTTACYCHYNGSVFLPGEIIYNGTSLNGSLCFELICEANCTMSTNHWLCFTTTIMPTPITSTTTTQTSTTPAPTTSTTTTQTSTTPAPTTSTTTTQTSTTPAPTTSTTTTQTSTTPAPTTSTTPTPTPTKKPAICEFDPPREHNETWMLCNCTKATCIENNTVIVTPIVCVPPPKIQCVNGRPPVPVMDDDMCCWHWECDCYCTGWGDPHYKTFDGLYYSYQGNCTYILVEEIVKTVDNFGVYIDNYHCDARDRVSCPRTIIVKHETQEILIKAINLMPIKVEVFVNNHKIATPYKKYGVKIYQSGINFVVEIAALKANISFNGMAFSIKLPYNLFGNNTQGQCGTCTNNQTDDCMLKTGKIISNCEIMADSWIVNDPTKPQCPSLSLTTLPPRVTVPPPSCKPSPLCDLIKGPTFSACHKAAPPEDFYQACVFDSCYVPNSKIECTSLLNYASVCAEQGICVNWRQQTLGTCEISCASHKVYKPCGPAEELTCKESSESSDVKLNNVHMVEGCFCPDGTIPFGSGIDVCVQICGCVGPDNIPRKFGEQFLLNCQDCICLEGGSGIICGPHQCKTPVEIACDEEGFEALTETSPTDSCCEEIICKCNSSLCTSESPKCGLGEEMVAGIPDGKCCPVYECVRKNVCIHGNAEYLPGSPVLSNKCETCVCTHNANSSDEPRVTCEQVPCNVKCLPGFTLKEKLQGECCGVCVQTHCVLNLQDGSYQIMNPGDMIPSKTSNCTLYSCVKINNQFITSISNISCPPFYEKNCEPGTIQVLPNGCCKICIEKTTSCKVREYEDYISYNKCRSPDKVSIPKCEGSCGTFSMYSAEANSMSHKCTCCQEVQTSKRQVQLRCPDGSRVTRNYTYVERCSCINTNCEPRPGTLPQQEESTELRRKRSFRKQS
uniref:Mucin-2 isoform X2 n=1 Tax=Geotrypetes seraphini TaxID=260995 RepID=A0A6P8P4R6_GEOSA|nr:mucin-2 isoform X2 [Geotrypetes seraphini]